MTLLTKCWSSLLSLNKCVPALLLRSFKEIVVQSYSILIGNLKSIEIKIWFLILW